MMYYDRNDISEGVDIAKSSNCNECVVCLDWFFNHGFEFSDSVYNGCHDLTMLSVNISSIVINTVKNVDYRCIIHNTSKPEAINLSKNSVLGDCGYI